MTIEQIAARARAEFLEMPGLRLTIRQAQRLWGLDARTCQAVIDRLVADSSLRLQDGHLTAQQ
jgi:hypothetical protein